MVTLTMHLRTAVVLFAISSASGESTTCASFGVNEIMQGPCDDLRDKTKPWPVVARFQGKVSWAIELPVTSGGPSFALCDEADSLLRFWWPTYLSPAVLNPMFLKEVSLAPFAAPVGAVLSGGKVYVACFGAGVEPHGTSGIVVVDLATMSVEAHHNFDNDGGVSHIHNVFAFQVDGKTEIFAATIGNPWTTPPVTGSGLMRLDTATGKFDDSYTTEKLSVRSAAQQSDGNVFVLTQEPAGKATMLARLEPKGGKFVVAARIMLPSRSAGDGGADVFVGHDLDTLFASDRGAGPGVKGMIYYYTYSNGKFTKLAGHETGTNPRYTTMLANGDIAACNQDDSTIQVFQGLANNPTATSVKETVVPSIKTVSFLIQSTKLQLPSIGV